MPEIFKTPLHRRYYAPYFSFSYVFFIGTAAAVILLPFFIAYSSHHFWLKENTYREQPFVKFKYKLLLLVQGSKSIIDSQVDESLTLMYSTISRVNAMHESLLRIPVIQSYETDVNSDGSVDRVDLHVMLPLAEGERVHNLQMLALFQYNLREHAKYQLEGLALVEHSSAVPGIGLSVLGDLVLKQKWPLPVKGGITYLYRDNPLLEAEMGAFLNAEEATFTHIFEEYNARNYTTEFVPTGYKVWKPAPVVGRPAAAYPLGTPAPPFNLTATINIPITRISYTPTVSEVLKNAWIQYLSFFVVVAFLLEKLCAFIYYNQVVETDMHIESSASQKGVRQNRL